MLQRLEGGDPTLPPSYQLKTSGPLLTSHLSDIRLYFTGTNATMPNHSYPGNSKTALKEVIEVQMKYRWCKTNVKHISIISSSFPNKSNMRQSFQLHGDGQMAATLSKVFPCQILLSSDFPPQSSSQIEPILPIMIFSSPPSFPSVPIPTL